MAGGIYLGRQSLMEKGCGLEEEKIYNLSKFRGRISLDRGGAPG